MRLRLGFHFAGFSRISPFSRARVAACGAVLVMAMASAHLAHAQGGGDKVAAEALFDEGRKLMQQNKFAEACPKFAESEKLDPTPSTLLNLASCYEKLGRTATAWATYKQAASAANAAKRADYLASAQKHASALEPRLARLTITAAAPVDGMEIRRDGAAVGRGEWNVAIPVDPGTHAIEASAPKKVSYKTQVDVKEEGSSQTVTIPALEDAPDATPPTPPTPSTSATTPPPASTVTPPPIASSTAPPGADTGGGSSQKTIGLVVGVVGLVGVGVGTAFAISAKSKYDDSLKSCPNDKNLCTQDGVTKRDDARSAGNIATIAMGVGAAALVTGVVLWLTAPSDAPKTATTTNGVRVQLAPTLGGGMVQGQW